MHLSVCNALHHTTCRLGRPLCDDEKPVRLVYKPSSSARRAARTYGTRVYASVSMQSGVPAELEKIIGGFSMVPDPKIKYQQLLFYAKKLKPMAAALHTEENKVQGCVSQVWVHPRVDNGKIFWEADSDSALTKGLAALLVQGLSGSTAADIVAIPPDFIDRLGLQQSLTPSRNNGFLNMFRLMQRKSLDLVQREEHGAQEAAAMPKPVPSDAMCEQPIEESREELKAQEVQEDAQAQHVASQAESNAQSAGPSGPSGPSGPQSASLSATSSATTNDSQPAVPRGEQPPPQTMFSPVQAVQTALHEAFAPTRLEVQHSSHRESRGQNGSMVDENHFQIRIDSNRFEGVEDTERQRMVEQLLSKVMHGDSWTLALTAQMPAEGSR